MMRPRLLFSLLVIIQTVIFSCSSSIFETNSFKDIFDHYRDKEDILALSLPPSLISLVMPDDDETGLRNLFRNLSSFSMLVIDENSASEEVAAELYAVTTSYAERNNFENLIFVNQSGEQFYIKVLEKNEIITEALIVIGGQDALTAINLRGNIDPEMLTGLAEQGALLDIPGLDLPGF